MLVVFVTIAFMGPLMLSAYAKGLTVHLAINTNLQSQTARIETFQFGTMIAVNNNEHINPGTTNIDLQYSDGFIEDGASIQICVTAQSDNIRSCGNGYNSQEKKPEYVSVDLYGSIPQPQLQQEPQQGGQSQSQSQSLGPIYICPSEGECVIK